MTYADAVRECLATAYFWLLLRVLVWYDCARVA